MARIRINHRAHVIQALNAEVLLDYMWNHRKDVDKTRIGANGGSGGGTHYCLLLTVLDDRITAAAPTVDLASHFDGGCPCESGKPIQLAGHGTCNAELMAFFAPKPLLVVSDGGDWTSSVPTLEYPYLQYIYIMYGAKEQVTNVAFCLRSVTIMVSTSARQTMISSSVSSVWIAASWMKVK